MTCGECVHWREDERKLIERSPAQGVLEFRLCTSPGFVPLTGKAAPAEERSEALVFVKGTARHQLFTHRTFGCALARRA